MPIRWAATLVCDRHYLDRFTFHSEEKLEREPRKDYVPGISVTPGPSLRRTGGKGHCTI
jgi:hypothetical protein